MAIATIILAAGSASRMGKIKQLLPIPAEGITFLENAWQASIKSGATYTVCVLGAYSAEILDYGLPEGCYSITNPEWNSGMGSSIAKGIHYIIDNWKDIEGVVITLADQPNVTPYYINTLIATHKNNKNYIVATAYEKSIGVPALFPKAYFKNLLKLEAKEGAKKLLQVLKEKVIPIKPDFNNIDVDTPDDYENFTKKISLAKKQDLL